MIFKGSSRLAKVAWLERAWLETKSWHRVGWLMLVGAKIL